MVAEAVVGALAVREVAVLARLGRDEGALVRAYGLEDPHVRDLGSADGLGGLHQVE